VRDDDRTYHSALPSCAAHRDAGRNDNGIYLVGDPAVPRRCEMTIAGGGWTNALDLDSLREPCPRGWQETAMPRLCVHGVVPSTMTTASITAKAPLASYDQVMVSVIGFQYGTTDGFGTSPSLTIDDAYVDGLSITTAETPRRHIASYAVGLREDASRGGGLLCPCLGGQPPPPFVPGLRPPSEATASKKAWRCIGSSCGFAPPSGCSEPVRQLVGTPKPRNHEKSSGFQSALGGGVGWPTGAPPGNGPPFGFTPLGAFLTLYSA
jgi:hypothetical protein